jgi:cation diffusion facilitator CzcD-associated flavoprotein CzcO
VLIIGSGFGGIGMAIALQRAGVDDFVILEKARDVGGVWRDNSYPGAACDVPSHLYSFSFEPNPDWSRMFASQAEIHAYLRRCAEKYRLLPRIRFGTEVESAAFDEPTSTWRVSLTGGETLRAAILITATGLLSRPSVPTLPGIQEFKGPSFHSARWDHGYALAGKSVAVVGTGASAIQFVPAIADTVRQLTVFQRSPPHMMPRPDRAYSTREQSWFRRWPWVMKLHRAVIYISYEWRALGFTRFTSVMRFAVGRPSKNAQGAGT